VLNRNKYSRSASAVTPLSLDRTNIGRPLRSVYILSSPLLTKRELSAARSDCATVSDQAPELEGVRSLVGTMREWRGGFASTPL
jgi:hypothetical protein